MSRMHDALTRTLLLMRDEIRDDTSDAVLLNALTTTTVVLTADRTTLASHAAQTAFVTTALLCARSGHTVHLAAPDVPMLGPQPPLTGTTLTSALLAANGRVLPGRRSFLGAPQCEVDLEIRLGSAPSICSARQSFALSATAWDATLSTDGATWPAGLSWPLGAMAGASIAAATAFNVAMRKLRLFARDPAYFEEFFAPTGDTRFSLASAHAPMPNDLGTFDFISGGAITHAALYSLAHIPAVKGSGRVFEPDTAESSNLNRYALLLADHVGSFKAAQLAAMPLGQIELTPAVVRYQNAFASGPLARFVLVGVDHIPTRWHVQRAQPRWLGVGATTHWSAMASSHQPGEPCAGCLHPYDDPNDGPIPTVAFVSFMAGLQLAAYFLQALGDGKRPGQQTFITMPRPNIAWRGPVAWHTKCPIGHATNRAAA